MNVVMTALASICFRERFSDNFTLLNCSENPALSKISPTIPISDAAGILLSVN